MDYLSELYQKEVEKVKKELEKFALFGKLLEVGKEGVPWNSSADVIEEESPLFNQKVKELLGDNFIGTIIYYGGSNCLYNIAVMEKGKQFSGVSSSVMEFPHCGNIHIGYNTWVDPDLRGRKAGSLVLDTKLILAKKMGVCLYMCTTSSRSHENMVRILENRKFVNIASFNNEHARENVVRLWINKIGG